MRRLARLDVSLDVAMHLFMVWLLVRWAVPLPFSMGFTFCGSPLVDSLGFLWREGSHVACPAVGMDRLVAAEARTQHRQDPEGQHGGRVRRAQTELLPDAQPRHITPSQGTRGWFTMNWPRE